MIDTTVKLKVTRDENRRLRSMLNLRHGDQPQWVVLRLTPLAWAMTRARILRPLIPHGMRRDRHAPWECFGFCSARAWNAAGAMP